jgi:capsular exopolysaccharide synthesis family protein
MEHKYPSKPVFADEESIDFKRYLSLFISNWYWFAVVLFLSISLAYGINRYSERIFTVSASMLIKDDQSGGGANEYGNIFQGVQMFNNQQNLKNEIGMLRSFSLNKRVIDSLPEFHIGYARVGTRNIVERRLYKDSPFIIVTDSNKLQPFGRINLRFTSEDNCIIEINGRLNVEETVELGSHFEKYGYCFTIYPRKSGQKIFSEDLSNKYLFWFDNPVRIAYSYRSRLGIEPIEEAASLVTLSVSGPVAVQEADYLNKLMELYILQGLELKNQKADSTISFISDQLELILTKLTSAESELEEFRRNNKLIDLSSEGVIIQRKIENNENELAILDLQKQYYKYLIDYLDSKTESEDIISPTVMGVTDPLLTSLIQELAQVQRQKFMLGLNLSGESAPIHALDTDLIRLRTALSQNIEGGELRINTSINDIKEKLSLVEKEIRKLPATEQELIRIQRKFEINNTVYTYLLEKQAETGIARASNVSDNRIVDKASASSSTMVKPKVRNNYLLAFILGLLLPAISILIIDALNNKVIDKTDVEKRTDAPIIGFISHNEARSEIPVYEKPGSTLAESFRSIRTNLKFLIKETNNPVIAISSTVSAEGKTFISINLATIFAMLGKRVLLVGLDLRRPRIHKVLEVENGKGISTFLSGENDFSDIIQSTGIKNLFYAPSGPVPPNPAELIAGERMKEFIEMSKKEFDIVIIDTPPIAIVTDALLISAYVDAYLLVVRQRYTSKNTLSLIQDLYQKNSFNNVGIIINDISLTGYYGYGLRYGYYTGYGYSYGYSYYNAGGYGNYSYGTKKGNSEYYIE